MAEYERTTALGVREVLRIAEEVMTARLPLQCTAAEGHAITLSGGDGTLTVSAHRHGVETAVHAATDRLSTSRIDQETQYFLNQLPYQPGDVPTR